MTRSQQPEVSEEYSVSPPKEDYVYYDSVLDTVATVDEVSGDFVTYFVEQDVDNVHSDPMQQFLAWLAAERFVKIGTRTTDGEVEAPRADIQRVFRKMYGADPSLMDPIEIASLVISENTAEEIEFNGPE